MLVHRPFYDGYPSGRDRKTQWITEQKSGARLALKDVWKAPTNYKQPLWLLNSLSKLLPENFKTILRLVKTLGFRNLRIFWLKKKKQPPLLRVTCKHSFIQTCSESAVCVGIWNAEMFKIYFLSFLRWSSSEVLWYLPIPWIVSYTRKGWCLVYICIPSARYILTRIQYLL